jgi:hypothetical protein
MCDDDALSVEKVPVSAEQYMQWETQPTSRLNPSLPALCQRSEWTYDDYADSLPGLASIGTGR